MSPTKSKPYKLKSSKSPPSTSQSDLNRRRSRLSANEIDSEFEEIRRSIKSAAGIKTLTQPKDWHPIFKLLLDLEDDPTEELKIFPRFALWFLMLLACWSRYLIITGHEGMAMIHPHEHMKTVEAAHLSVYGFGYQLNETSYLDPQINDTTSPPTAKIYKQIYVNLLRIQKQLGIHSASPFMFCREVHVAVATLTPFFVYLFARTVYGQCRDIAFMAANLVAFSKHLIIYACHPFSQSFFSPLLFLSATVIYKVWPLANSVSRSLMLLFSGCAFGVITYIQADSVILISMLFLLISPSNLTSKLQYLPSSLRLTSAFTILTGMMLGFQFGAVQDRISYRSWFITPYRLLKIRLQHNPDVLQAVSKFYVFLCASHVHWALLTASIICSLIYLSYKQRWTLIFDGWLGTNNHENLFKMTSKLTLTTAILLIYNVHPHQLVFSHDTLIFALISGASAVYLLYRGLYVYIMSIANPHRTTKNVIKLIVYGELFLYMFESRLTLPSTTNAAHSISTWAHKSLNESAQVNWCLDFVSKQDDVTGVFIDFPVEMTGGYAVLQKQVPTISVIGSNFAEFDPKTKHFTNLYSLRNPLQFIKSIVDNLTYNYIIISGGRKFFNHGFRKVYNDTDVRVYKRSNSFTERQKLDDLVNKLGSDQNADVIEEESVTLILFGLYDKAVERLKSALEQNSTVFKLWQLLIYAVNLTNVKADSVMNDCKAVFGTKCLDEYVLRSLSKFDQQWNITYRFL